MLWEKILLSAIWAIAAVACVWLAVASKNGTLKRNAFAGYRLPITQKSDATWKAAHIASWKWTVLMAVGPAIGAVGTAFASSEQAIMWWCLVVIVPTSVACIGGVVTAVSAAKKVATDTQVKGS